MPSRKRQERIVLILDSLRSAGRASIRELAATLDVSEMTVRRDLQLLAAEGRARIVHAGAIPSDDGPARAFSLSNARSQGGNEKMRIGQKAASLLEPGDVVIIDSGATTEWLARSIPPDLPITILCFALNIALEAGRHPARTVVLAGGELKGETLVYRSPEGVSLVRRYRANKAFLSAGGASETLGVTCIDAAEAELKKAAVGSSRTRILLADSRKFGRVTPAWFADLKDFDAIVTDPGISLEYVEIVRNLGIALHVV
ncbi:MAG: DeoR/GlpR family DNA-binding transcription regulator [Spirochaetia bacterium]|jgi:DeoR family deoxyribose operon repressor